MKKIREHVTDFFCCQTSSKEAQVFFLPKNYLKILCRKIPALIMLLLRPKTFSNDLEIKPERPDQDGFDMYKKVSWSEKGGCRDWVRWRKMIG